MITVDVDGARELFLAMDKVAGVPEQAFDRAKPRIAEAFYAIEKEQFETEGGRVGRKFAPLTRRYQEYKRAYLFGDTGTILRRTGKLRRSLIGKGEEGGIYEETKDSLTLGSSVPYALAHQRGAPSRHLPARPPIQLIGKDAKILRAAFADQVQKEVRKHWRNPAAVAEDFYLDLVASGDIGDGDFLDLGL